MSDAMTNREIEDVLTSIRRLVAQDGVRPVDRVAEAPPRDAGRLILTDAHRVDTPPETAASPANPMPEPDFGRLEATIAELEAAVSASGGTWDSDAPADAPRASNVTELYGRFTATPRRLAPSDEAAATALPAEVKAEPVEAVIPAEPASETVAEPTPQMAESPGESVLIDEAALYALVAQIVRDELHGQLGERITAQVRKLVRAEIAKALDERKFL